MKENKKTKLFNWSLLSLTNLAIWTNTFVTCQPTNNCSTIDTATMTTVPMTTATMTTLTYGQFLQIRRSKLLRAFLKNGPFPSSFFFIFIFSIQLTANVQYKCLPMSGFELRTSGIRSNHSTNWATTTAPFLVLFCYVTASIWKNFWRVACSSRIFITKDDKWTYLRRLFHESGTNSSFALTWAQSYKEISAHQLTFIDI